MTLPSHVDHLVVGAGFAGVALAIGLQQDGEEFLVIEKDESLGGTWWANTYPGATCDIPSHLYSFSFAPNPDWSHAFSPQAEILAYLEKVAAEAGVLDRFHFGVELLEASWDDEAVLWRVRTSAGDLTSTTLINATGGLSAPKLPEIEGIETFAGRLFHTAQWDHDVDLAGRRVAVIGTGASAIQVVPAIQPEVGHLDVYQRSAPWVIPRGDHPFTTAQKRRWRRFPALQRAYRARLYYSHEALVPGITRWQRLNAPAERLGRRNLAKGVPDPELRARLTPRFGIFCKRILVSDDYYPAMSAANVEVVTDPIARITPTGVVTYDGVERPVDVLIVATGFHATDPPIRHLVRGRDGQHPRRGVVGRRDGDVQGHDRARLPEPLLGARGEHRPGPHLGDRLHRGAHRLRARRDPDPAPRRVRRGRAARGRPGPLERRHPAPHAAHRVDAGRVHVLVPRRPRPQPHPLAAGDRRVPARGQGVRRGRVRRAGGPAMRSFDGRVVAITGAGSGIGRALAVDLAGRGALLALSDVSPDGLAETVDLVKAAGVREVRSDVVDVASADALAAWAEDVVGQLGRVNVLISNAGVSLTGEVADLDPADMEWIVGINFWGVVNGTRAFLPHLIASGDGHVVTMSSLFGLLSIPGQSMYNATKYAVRGFSESLREELLMAGHPVGVTVVHPGGIRTAIARNARVSWREDHESFARMFDEQLARMSPERAAEIILRGVLRGKPRVLVGLDAHLLHQFARIAGARYQDVVARRAARMRRP